MKRVRCAAVRRRLPAFCDGEMTLDAQVVIEAHLKQCDACMAEAGVIQEIGDTLRAVAGAALQSSEEDVSVVQAAVLPRIEAERATSITQRIGTLFEDRHMMWATGSGVMAGVICGVIASAMMYVTQAQPESLAALVQLLSQESAAVAPRTIELPRVYADAIMPATVMNQARGEEAVSALAALVRRDGSLADIELLQPDGRARAARGRQARLAFDLLDAVSTARFEPARVAGAPVPLNVVWLLTHMTVRGRAPVRAKASSSPRPSAPSGVAAG